MKWTLVQGLERAVSRWHPPKTIFQNLIFSTFSNSFGTLTTKCKTWGFHWTNPWRDPKLLSGANKGSGPWRLTLRLWTLSWLSCLLENQVSSVWPSCPLVEGTRASVLGSEIALSLSQGSFSLPWGLRRFPSLGYTVPRIVPCFFFLFW